MVRKALAIPTCLHLALSFACSDGDDDSSSSGGMDADAGDEAGEPGGGPKIQELLSNTPTLTAHEAVIITAIVVDADGLDDIVAGKLTTEDGTGFYGAFAAIGGGTYQIALSWQQIGQTSAIQFMGSEQVRVFRAEFSDLAGNRDEKTLELRLSCDSGAACDNRCVHLDYDLDHCGQCGNACDGPVCENGDCPYY